MPIVTRTNVVLTLTLRFSLLLIFVIRYLVLSLSIFHSDETGGGGSSSSSPSFLPKKSSDLTLRKVRRHVLQLIQHWKNANNNIQYRLKILQRAQTVDRFFFGN